MLKIANGVPSAQAITSNLRDELGISADQSVIVAVGSLYRVKGHHDLLNAAAILLSEGHDIHVVIAGRGNHERALRSLGNSLGIDERVHLLGLRSDIANVLAAGDVFVLPSRSEALPLALLEAMFAASPIVATDVGEVRNVLCGGHAGLIVPPGHVDDLATAVAHVLRDKVFAQELGRRARERAAAQYSLERMSDRYWVLYEPALRRV
jgi:glycosyltransferase involved in cell wall biosynthesis